MGKNKGRVRGRFLEKEQCHVPDKVDWSPIRENPPRNDSISTESTGPHRAAIGACLSLDLVTNTRRQGLFPNSSSRPPPLDVREAVPDSGKAFDTFFSLFLLLVPRPGNVFFSASSPMYIFKCITPTFC